MLTRVKTPCIRICSTSIGDEVCRGCKRFNHEVIDWNAYSESQRRLIAERLEGFLTQVVANKLQVFDAPLLASQMRHQNIRFDESQDPHCWAFKLLEAGASQVALEDYGLALGPAQRGQDLVEIKDAIDKDFYALSCAYYERYIAPGKSEAKA